MKLAKSWNKNNKNNNNKIKYQRKIINNYNHDKKKF